MYKDMKQYRCGGCGYSDYSLYANPDSPLKQIITVCNNCQSQSEINLISKLNIEWGNSGDGLMTFFSED